LSLNKANLHTTQEVIRKDIHKIIVSRIMDLLLKLEAMDKFRRTLRILLMKHVLAMELDMVRISVVLFADLLRFVFYFTQIPIRKDTTANRATTKLDMQNM
jgi:hypothetical protein